MGTQSTPLSPSFNGRVIKDDANDRLYVTDSNNVPVALLGKDSTGAIVVKVAKSGQNVITAPDNELIFNSNQDVFKIVDRIPTSIPSFSTTYNSGNNETSGVKLLAVPHGQTYAPIVRIYVQGQMINANNGALITSSYIPLPIYYSTAESLNCYTFPNSGGTTSYAGVTILYGVDNTNVYIQALLLLTGNNADTMASIPVTIYVLEETAS